jgi:integrase
LAVQPSGGKSFKLYYTRNGKQRWLSLGKVGRINLADARKRAQLENSKLHLDEKYDPQAERLGRRNAGLFKGLCDQYVEDFARHRHKCWEKEAYLLNKYVIPSLGRRGVWDIPRADIRALFRRLTGDSGPILANTVLATTSAVFSWAIREEIVDIPANPCRLIQGNPTKSRERVLSDDEVHAFWATFDNIGEPAGSMLRVLLLTGQRPGEVVHMRRQDVIDGWWLMPGEPTGAWPGTKNDRSHRVWLTEPAVALVRRADDGRSEFVFNTASRRGRPDLGKPMRSICTQLKLVDGDKVTPHDLRRTHGTTITRLGFGRPAMNRIQNHAEGGIASVYDQHDYAAENRRVQEAVAQHILELAGVRPRADNVVAIRTGDGA